jgi:hypothetical protein
LPQFSCQNTIKRNAADYYRINKQYAKAQNLYKELLRKMEAKPKKTSEDNEEIFEVCLILADMIKIRGDFKAAAPFY